MTVSVKFIHHAWDNYQGATGKIIKMERLINVPSELRIDNLKSLCIKDLDHMGYCDKWSEQIFTGDGIISISIL
jgi:hypothetical protein